jgi:hypothetical protein
MKWDYFDPVGAMAGPSSWGYKKSFKGKSGVIT